ncbi:MAG TPA: hypothetical protein VGK73_33995 [Polyangiaceae bacterium]
MSQIAELSDVVAQELGVRKFPYAVAYGPERSQRTGPGIAIGVVFERDRNRGDLIAPPVATRQGAATAEAYYSRQVAGAFTVYAQCPKSGARARDHEAEADAVCDAVISAMTRACKLAGKPVAFGACRFLEASDFNGLEQWPGAAVRVEFSVAVPIRDVDYRGRGPDTGVVSDTSNTAEATLVAAPEP